MLTIIETRGRQALSRPVSTGDSRIAPGTYLTIAQMNQIAYDAGRKAFDKGEDIGESNLYLPGTSYYYHFRDGYRAAAANDE